MNNRLVNIIMGLWIIIMESASDLYHGTILFHK